MLNRVYLGQDKGFYFIYLKVMLATRLDFARIVQRIICLLIYFNMDTSITTTKDI